MALWKLAAKNVLRNELRTLMTVLAVALMVVTFVMLRTLLQAWDLAAEYAAKDRLSTRARLSFGLSLPKKYLDNMLTNLPGIHSATYCDWFGGRWSKDPSQFFANLACAENAFDVYPEIAIQPAALARWRSDKTAAIVGDMLAKKLGLKVGDRLTLVGTFYPGDWELTIVGIYTAPLRSAMDRSTFFFRWDYKNERVPARQKDRIGWIFTRVDDASKGPALSRAIDRLFEERDVQTVTTGERAASNALLGGVSAILRALQLVSAIVLAIMALILANTIAMGVRERTSEYAVLRSLGFSPRHIELLIVMEALLVSLVAGMVGLMFAFPVVQMAMGAWLEENMGKFFPVFRITPGTAATAMGLTLALGLVASLIPAVRAGRTALASALRTVA
jgi:putative ABC transport system permease protein